MIFIAMERYPGTIRCPNFASMGGKVMTGMRIGAKTVSTWSDLQIVFDVFSEPKSPGIEFYASAAPHGHWFLGEFHDG
jgi:hypothetical protein